MVGNCSCNSIVVLLCLSGSWSHLVQAARFATPALSSNIFLFQEYRSMRRESQRARDDISLQLASLLEEGTRRACARCSSSVRRAIASPFSGVLESASRQKICYDRGGKLQGLTTVAWLCPQSTPDRL